MNISDLFRVPMLASAIVSCIKERGGITPRQRRAYQRSRKPPAALEPSSMDGAGIEILTVAGCPNAVFAWADVEKALALEARTAKILDVVVDGAGATRELRFLAAPSVRVNAHDLDPDVRAREEYAVACRAYRDGSRFSGSPRLSLIRDAIRHIA